MSLKHFALLSAISFNNPENSNNKITKAEQAAHATTNAPQWITEVVNRNKNNKTTLRQLTEQQEKQKEQQSKQIAAPLSLDNPNTTITTTITSATTTSRSSAVDKFEPEIKSADGAREILSDDSTNYSSESSSEFSDSSQQTTVERHPSNTYTSTTYYGSGFGVFHQQNIRSNGGGGIALITGSGASNGMGGSGSYSNGINNNVNLLLGGAMLTLITTILCVVCYCCHRNIKKRTEAAYRQQRQWLENDPNMEIYSVEQCYETSGLFVAESMDGLATIPTLHHEPPPSYDAVVAMQEQQQLLLQQHQQQLMIQQQLIQQQQLLANNSPPPGYRSSLDVNSIIQQGRLNGLAGPLVAGGDSTISDMDINSLASSSVNIRTSASISPIDPLLNYNDVNGNVASTANISTPTPSNNISAPCYLRNKQHQPQRNAPAAHQISQLNMKKVLQAQSCCSLQRAEVENMWNAAAAALAARSAHLPSDQRASSAFTSSPTLATNTRKLSQGCKTTPNSNTTETFGSRYLKQNYYRRGCPLCGKFRYDNNSTLSISMESNLDILAGDLADETTAESHKEKEQNNLNNNENLTNALHEAEDCEGLGEGKDENLNDDLTVGNNNSNEQHQCSCMNSVPGQKNDIKSSQVQKGTDRQNKGTDETDLNMIRDSTDDNANEASLPVKRQSRHQSASNNNNDITTREDSMNLPTTSAEAAGAGAGIAPTVLGVGGDILPASTSDLTSSTVSTPSVAINLDCINENGIISLDMSKIIDKTGLPTYDGALKLESSGYV